MIYDFPRFLTEVWHYKPSLIILFAGGLIMLVLLVIDTYRHRRHRKERHRIRHFH